MIRDFHWYIAFQNITPQIQESDLQESCSCYSRAVLFQRLYCRSPDSFQVEHKCIGIKSTPYFQKEKVWVVSFYSSHGRISQCEEYIQKIPLIGYLPGSSGRDVEKKLTSSIISTSGFHLEIKIWVLLQILLENFSVDVKAFITIRKLLRETQCFLKELWKKMQCA